MNVVWFARVHRTTFSVRKNALPVAFVRAGQACNNVPCTLCMHPFSLQTDNGRDGHAHSEATLHSRYKESCFFLFSDNRGGSLTLLFSFRVRCVIPSSLSSLHFGLTKIAKIMQNHRRILLKCIFLVGIFFSDGKS